MSRSHISVPENLLRDFCRRHHIRRLAFFGSVLRSDFGPDSDVDVLVEFERGHVPGLAFFAIEEDLTKILGRKVDLHTSAFLGPEIRAEALAEAEVQHVAP